MAKIYDQYGIPRQVDDLSAVRRLTELKRQSQLNPWPVIEECFNIWTGRNPKEWKSYIYYLNDVKETRKTKAIGGKSFSGVTKDKVNDGYLSYTVDVPEPVLKMIRCIYSPEELPMDKEFFKYFIKKFPKFAIREARN